jgi:hypothetical protein
MLYLLLYGCEPRAVILRRGCRLRVFEKRVLWKVFGRRLEKVARCETPRFVHLTSILWTVKSRRIGWA